MTTDRSLQKADFGAIYDQPDPRSYFATLGPFGYAIPQHGADLYAQILGERAETHGRRPRIVDVCCSYGVVGMLLKTDLRMNDLYAHYGGPATSSLTSEELTTADKRLLEKRALPDAPHVIGLDVAGNAVDYAVETGALDAGATENLETDGPSDDFAAQLAEVDLITTTGGVGYVSEKTFDRLLDATPDTAWVGAFCLRSYDYSPIEKCLDAHGLQTERVDATFPQRRFTGPEEQEWAFAEVRARGHDPAGKETDGFHHAEFFLSRPADDVAGQPLADMVGSVVSPPR